MSQSEQQSSQVNRPLNGKVALVTGGSAGYGKGIAQCLVEAGATVWITGRRADRLQAAAREIGAKQIVADATVSADCDRTFETLLQHSGRLDILINNAGGAIRIAPMTEQTDAEIAASVQLNLTGAMFGSGRAARIMCRQKEGTIVHISSVCSLHAWPGWAPYSAAKAGLDQFSRALYTEVRPHGVRVTNIIPSWGDTDFNRAAGIADPAAEAPERKVISPEELGKIVVSVCQQPKHLVIPEMIVQPMIQDIVPM